MTTNNADIQLRMMLQNTETELKQLESQYIQMEAEILRIKDSLGKVHGGILSLQNIKPVLEQWWNKIQLQFATLNQEKEHAIPNPTFKTDLPPIQEEK